MNWKSQLVLITVKTYPTPSRKYGETVCVAGVNLKNKKWVRLYPIPFRDLDNERRFRKYNIIKVRACKSTDDKRPESYKIDAGSIKVINYLDPKDKWVRRKEVVLPTIDKSMCEILRQSKQTDKSLGIFRPKNIDFVWGKARPKDEGARKICYAQLSFVARNKRVPELIPFDFRYRFFCDSEPLCPGHNYSIIDWEIGQAYRDWRWKYRGETLLLQKIKERWFDRMCNPKNDVYFYVGNMKRFRDNFMVLGVFYPPK